MAFSFGGKFGGRKVQKPSFGSGGQRPAFGVGGGSGNPDGSALGAVSKPMQPKLAMPQRPVYGAKPFDAGPATMPGGLSAPMMKGQFGAPMGGFGVGGGSGQPQFGGMAPEPVGNQYQLDPMAQSLGGVAPEILQQIMQKKLGMTGNGVPMGGFMNNAMSRFGG